MFLGIPEIAALVGNWIVILLIVALIGLTIFLYTALVQKKRQVNTLAQTVEALKGNIETLEKKDSPHEAVEMAYLQFIYNLSHEVSNPLQSVQTNLENMADCSPEEVGRWRQYYGIIRHEMKRLTTLTDNLRLLSHLESADNLIKRQPVNMKSVIENVIMTQAERADEKKITLKYQGPNRPARVLGDRDLLYEVIINLVDNSIKYAKDSDDGEIVLMLSEDAQYMHVTVMDNGLGIPEEDLPFIFDTAYRSSSQLTMHRKGSGLGLAIVKRIVDQHDGRLRAESGLGEGTRITVDLPLYNPDASQTISQAARAR
jgi:signal transduction histidine kinase